MTAFFVSDTHFGHARAITLCARPFASVDEMDHAMIANWNAVVQHNDEIWHLGDFCYRNAKAAASYLARLSGARKHLIHGNHDSAETKGLAGWASSQPMAEIKVDGIRVTLCHYAMRVWPASHYGSLHLFGHSHGSLPGDRQSCDVGVDCWGYRPVALPEIQRHLATLPERGRHRGAKP